MIVEAPVHHGCSIFRLSLGIGKITKWKWANYKKIINVTAYVIPTRIKCTMSHVS